jgi:hypothetical protein
MIVPDSSRVLVLMLEHKCTSLVGTLKLFKCRPDYWDHYTHLSTYQSRKHQRYTNITRDTHSQLPFVPLSQSAPSHRFTPPEIHHSLTHNTHTATSHNTPPDQTSKVPAFLISKTSHPKTNPKAITNSHTPRHHFGSSSHMHVFFLLYSVTLPM